LRSSGSHRHPTSCDVHLARRALRSSSERAASGEGGRGSGHHYLCDLVSIWASRLSHATRLAFRSGLARWPGGGLCTSCVSDQAIPAFARKYENPTNHLRGMWVVGVPRRLPKLGLYCLKIVWV
jgi:hypothetical protein